MILTAPFKFGGFYFTYLALSLAFFFPRFASSQTPQEQDPDWSVLMQSPDVKPADVRAVFEAHWEGKERVKGSGYKQVERWLHLMDGRTDDQGFAIGSDASVEAHRSIMQGRESGRSANGNWQVCGPTLTNITTRENIRGVGRMNAIAFHPNDDQTIFAGAPAGGLWRSYDGGGSWVTNTDDLPTLGVSSIAFSSINPEIVYIGTGDRDASDSPGMGAMKSVDGGLTWDFVNDGMANLTVGDILVHPTDDDRVFAATNSGVFRSVDAGDTWEQVSSNTQNYKDLCFHPTNPEIVYSTGQGRFWRSEDGGDNWDYINDGINPSTRMCIAVTPAAPDNVYVLSTGTYEFRAFFKSTDAGVNFEEMSDSPNIMAWSASGDQDGGQAWYDLCLEADPVVVDRVYVGGIRMKRSDDGGATWLDIQDSYTHVDQHALVANPHTDEIWLANDGGVYRYDNNQQWMDMSNGIVTGEIYKIGQSPHAGTDAMNGYQDNGTYLFNGVQWSRGSGGDGFECIYDPIDPDWFFSSSQYGRLYRTGPGIQSQTIVANGELGIDEGGAWSTPFTLSYETPSTMFVGLLNVWRSTNIKHPVRDSIVWERISSELGGNDLTTMRVVHRHRSNENILFATEGSRKLFRCDSALIQADSVTWVDLSDALPLSAQPVLAVETVLGDSSSVYIGFSNRVWHSSDLGENWTEMEGDLPGVAVNTLVCDTSGTGGLYAGTDMGVYYWSNADSLWIDYSEGLPLTVRVTELELYAGNGPNDPRRIRAGTYGRGMWETDAQGATQGFPPIAHLISASGETSIFGAAPVSIAFRRNLLDVSMESFVAEDINVTNAVITSLESDEDGFTCVVAPIAYGPIELVVPEGVAIEQDGYGLANAASDTLRLVYHPVPEPLGPWGPGGVGDASSLTIWLRGDQGTFTDEGEVATDGMAVAEWRDVLSGNVLSATQNEVEANPALQSAAINGRAALSFDGMNDCVVASVVPMHREISAFTVAKGEDVAWNEHGWLGSAREDNGFILHPWKNQSSYQAVVLDDNGNYAQATPYWIVDASLPQFYGVIYGQSDWDQNFQTIVNDLRIPFPGSNIGSRAENSNVEVRLGWDFDNRFGEGDIAEHFIYGTKLFESHRTIVSNYVAARYGISMGSIQHYFREDFSEDVAGIGRENEWDQHDDAQGIGVVRVSNPQALDDGDYLFWGHDGGALEVVTSYPFLSSRLARTWAAEEIGDAGTVQLQFTDAGVCELFASAAIGVIVDDAENFEVGSAPAFYPLQNNGAYWSAEVDLPEHGVFTVGFEPQMNVQESFVDAGFTVYPNPANESMTLRLNNINPNGVSWRVFDTSGRLMQSGDMNGKYRMTWDVSSWSPGIYLVEWMKDGQRRSVPVMIQ
ncbi:MAG TPA: hypothetical protein DCX00_01545 [Flavobacteriales bacterium]|nr:hypothetical protein [Flavobacteriales bacterium]